MNKEIHIENPRYPYGVLFVITLIGGALIAHSELDGNYNLHNKIYASLILFAAIIMAVRIFLLYLMPRAKWKRWAAMHGGKYGFPHNIHISGYGLVLDSLEGKLMQDGHDYILMRTLELVFTATRNTYVRRYVVLAARPKPSSNGDVLINADSVIYAEQYHYKIPELEKIARTVKKRSSSTV